MSIESLFNKKTKSNHDEIVYSFPRRQPFMKKKNSRFLLSLPTPFRETNQEKSYEEEHKEEWMKFLNGYSDSNKVRRDLPLDERPVISNLFSGYSFYFDGYLGAQTRLQLVEMVRTHGGDVEHFYSSSRVSIIIAKNLCYSKEQHYKQKPSVRIIDPSWIVDSVEKNKLQPFSKYSILTDKMNTIQKCFGKEYNIYLYTLT